MRRQPANKNADESECRSETLQPKVAETNARTQFTQSTVEAGMALEGFITIT